LPIFALGTVLFPGGLLPLRVFEARYMDMIRGVMRDSNEFGVCLIRKGSEVGEREVETEEIGCRARIDDWNMEQLGVLQIATTGTDRFRIVGRRLQADGLLVADVEPLDDETVISVPDDALPCQALLRRIVERLEQAGDEREDDEVVHNPIAKPYRFDDSTWVGNRLCELLPIPVGAKQKLMALTDGPTRLEIVLRYLKQHGIV
jgi:Lon protease-like protein